MRSRPRSGFRGASVLAVDLSLTSLAYAMRKTRALGRANIDYAQADILKLGALGRGFDLIEAIGVLHHLADPLAGWRVLLSLLRPGGFMPVGLYSEIARADIVEARAFIAERGYRASADDIRAAGRICCPWTAAAAFKSLIASGDFFSTSACRDLLFHVQEHRLTLPQIAGFLADNALALVGFDLDHLSISDTWREIPARQAMTDLACWDRVRARPSRAPFPACTSSGCRRTRNA